MFANDQGVVRIGGRFFLLGVSGFLLSVGPTKADVMTIGAGKDNTIYSDFDLLSNGAGSHFFAGKTAGGNSRRALIAFDVAGVIPAGSTIDNVTLQLYMSRTQAGNQSVTLHRLLADWGEGTSDASGGEGSGAIVTDGDATWRYRFYDLADPPASPQWASTGGDFTGTSSASASVGNIGFYTWGSTAQMVADVQGWLDTPSTNYGWLVMGNEGPNITAKRFDSHENGNASQRPMLTITFTPPPAFGACCFNDSTCMILAMADCSNQGGTYQGDGTTCTPNPCPSIGACCRNVSCLLLTSSDCDNVGGTYQGDGTICSPNPCIPPTGACCFSGAICIELSPTDCTTQSGDYQGDGTTCTPNPCPLNLEPFVDPLPIPGIAQPINGVPGGTADYEIAIRQVQQQLHRDLAPTTVWGYNGQYPGPTILATTGLPITVKWINDLRDSMGVPRTDHYLAVDLCPHGAADLPKVVTHLHGGHIPADSDGHPEDTFLPGADDTYYYPNNQPAATLWYHDHALGITRLNVYMGLAGFYIIRDAVEDALDLPDGEFDIGLAIQDRTFNLDGTLLYPSAWQDHFFGDVILVNGKVWPFLNVKRGKYRFRILGGSNSRTYTLSLSNSATFHQIGTDGGLLETPVPLTELTISPGERADVVMDFEPYAPGTEIILTNSAPSPFPGTPGVGVVPNVMKFIVTADAGYTTPLPATLRPVEQLQEVDAVQDREFVLRKFVEPCTGSEWLINGLQWDDITELPVLGTTEVWRFVNRSGIMHPMHMHLVFFQVLDRQMFEIVDDEVVPIGSPIAPAPNEAGWKDTVQVGPSEIVRVIAHFDDYTGLYPYHCHILEHEDHEMMRQFRAVCTKGDVNQDARVDSRDIDLFVDTLINGAMAGTAEFCATDMNDNQTLEMPADVTAFVNCLVNGTCP